MINNKKTIGFILLIFIVIVSFSILFFQKKNTKQPSVTSSSQPQITQEPLSETAKDESINLPQLTKGQLFLEKENKLPIKLDQNFNLVLKASISQEDIVGLDIVISYDSQALEFIAANSLKEEFALVSVKKENYLRLTAAKKPSFTQPTLFFQTPVVQLTFKAKKKGLFTISVLSIVNNEKTQFINNKTEIFYPQTTQIEIEAL